MNKISHRIHRVSVLPITIAALLATSMAWGQDALPDDAIALSRNDIVGAFVAEALQNNPGLKAYDKRYQAARESITSSRALPDPKVQLTHFVESIQTRTGPQRDALMLQQPIPWLGKLKGSSNIARAQSDSLWHAYAAQQFEIVEKVAEHTLEIAYHDKAIALTIEHTLLLKQLENLAEERVKSGGNLTDLLRLQVEIERFDDLVAQQQTQRLSESARLESILGRQRPSSIFEIKWQSPNPLTSDLNQWFTAIRNRNPRLSMLRALETSQEARERLADLANKPDFSVGINYLRTGDALNPAMIDSGKDPWAIMVGVSLPIWGKANHSISLQASLQKEAITAQIEEQELQLVGEARAWIAKLEDSQKRLHRYDTRLLPLARQAIEITESSYRANKAALIDVIDSERTLIELETKYWRAAADAWIARWKLATLSGGLWLN